MTSPPEGLPPRLERHRLPERLAALPGLERIREAAGETPAFLVGGAVRDLLLGRDRTDVDIVLEGDPEPIARRLGGEVVSHERFATAKARAGELEADLAGARAESYPRPGALPEVRPATLSEDLARRDFTINAMAVPLHGEPWLIDPHGGAADLERGRLRVLHESSFLDDPTRALRAARYAARFGFELEPETERLARGADLATVSTDRVEAELLKLAAEPDPRRGFELLEGWGLMKLPAGAGPLIEEVVAVLGRPPWKRAADRALAVHAVATGHGVGPAGRPRDLLAGARELAEASPGRPSEAVELARGRSGVELVLARAQGADWLERYMTEWSHVRLEITGDDLLEAGVPEGPAVGRGLAAALRRKLDGEITGRAQELVAALESARSSQR